VKKKRLFSKPRKIHLLQTREGRREKGKKKRWSRGGGTGPGNRRVKLGDFLQREKEGAGCGALARSGGAKGGE